MKNDLRVLRAKHDLTQAELAEQLGVSRQTVNAIETGKYDPSLPLAFKIARMFGLTIEEIFSAGSGKQQSETSNRQVFFLRPALLRGRHHLHLHRLPRTLRALHLGLVTVFDAIILVRIAYGSERFVV
jgi:putative transcriptional regulator